MSTTLAFSGHSARKEFDSSLDDGAPATRPLKVCHVSLTLNTGGLERILADLARHHDRDVVEPTFLAIHDVGRFGIDIRRAGCKVIPLRAKNRLAQVRAMSKLFRAEHFDVVHTHNTYPHIYASLAARWASVPVIVSTRHGQRTGQGWRSTFTYRFASRLIDRVVAVSDDAARLCVDADGLSLKKVCRIWNGIDVDQFAYRGPITEPVAIAVGRLSAEKDFPTLLRAVALASKRIPRLRLRIVGDGPDRENLETLSQELDLGDWVEFLGERHDVAELLADAAFYVTSSLTEGVSLTLLEAMAVGLPVVATAVGGNPEVVVDGVTGRLAPAGDPEALANAIVMTCHAPECWADWGAAGRERVMKHFDVRRMAAEYEDLYRRLVDDKRALTGDRRAMQSPVPSPSFRWGRGLG